MKQNIYWSPNKENIQETKEVLSLLIESHAVYKGKQNNGSYAVASSATNTKREK